MALTDFTIIRRSMSSRLFSTITTVLTVAVAVGLMLVLLSMRHSGRKAFERGSGNMHLLVSADSNALTAILNGVFYANPPQRPITWSKYNELVNGIFNTRAVGCFQRVIGRMKTEGCDAVILGCTEIPLIVNDANSPLPTLDSTRLLARAALQRAEQGAAY